jgi:hypothetical protein
MRLANQKALVAKKGTKKAFVFGMLIAAIIVNASWFSVPYAEDAYYKFFPKEYEEFAIVTLNVIGPRGAGFIQIMNTGKVVYNNVDLDVASILFWRGAAKNLPYLCEWCKFTDSKGSPSDKTYRKIDVSRRHKEESRVIQ